MAPTSKVFQDVGEISRGSTQVPLFQTARTGGLQQEHQAQA